MPVQAGLFKCLELILTELQKKRKLGAALLVYLLISDLKRGLVCCAHLATVCEGEYFSGVGDVWQCVSHLQTN